MGMTCTSYEVDGDSVQIKGDIQLTDGSDSSSSTNTTEFSLKF